MRSEPADFDGRFGSTGRSSRPCARSISQSARLPTTASRSAAERLRTSTSFSMPCSRSLRGRHRADAPQRVDRQALQEALDPLGRDHGQAVRLLPARGDLRQELVGRDAGRRGQPGGLADLLLEPPRHGHAERFAPRVLGDVEIRLVERQRLDQRRDLAVEREDLLRHGAVLLEVRADDHQRRAQAHGARHRDRRAHAERPRLVARRRDDAALVGSPPTATGRPRSVGLSRCSTDA